MNVTQADPKQLDRYGRNSFGWSLLMARQLVAAGVSLVQVNLGNDETWDTHGKRVSSPQERSASTHRQSCLGSAG